MDVVLDAAGDPAITGAVRTSIALAGLDTRRNADDTVWWRAGVADGLERATGDARPFGYDAALPPRSTRGATRA